MRDDKYNRFLEKKITKTIESGFDINESDLNINLFDFQKFIVRTALKKGRYAVFAECGLGKTLMQLEWANHVTRRTEKPVLILAPLAVSGQTIQEGKKFGIHVEKLKSEMPYGEGIYITNYEQLTHIIPEMFSGIVLDESSILKNFTGVTKRLLLQYFEDTPYKLCCTATPAPNDFNEIGNHSEFLNILDSTDMRSRWFVRDEGMNNYRLKGHAKQDFFNWISSWAIMLTNPSDIGFDGSKYILPKLQLTEIKISTESRDNGKLFNDVSVNATNFNQELRLTKEERLQKAIELVNSKPKESFIIWVKQNEEADFIKAHLPEAVEVRGDEKTEIKEEKLLSFADGGFRILLTKSKIAQFGMNFQSCHNQIFASLDFSFESMYQSVRRSYRFGQKEQVNIYLITTDTMQNVISSIQQKENQFKEMQFEMNKYSNSIKYGLKMDYDFQEYKTENFWLMNGDSIVEIDRIPDNSLDFSIFSPPFSSLFTYSDNLRDMGNCEDHTQFFEQYGFLLEKLYKKMKPGRLIAVHTKDLAKYKNSSGYSGLYDFTGDNHRAVEKAGFKYHSKVTIWTDPVLEMQRTKTQRLLYKTLTTDSSYTGIGMPEYVTIFRKWEGNEEDWTPVTNINKQNFPLDIWQQWASPVWMDIRRTDVLNGKLGTAQGDEKHICPLQLGVIKRCIHLWTNKGETVFTPFAGIGSELYESILNGRKAIGIELKESYYKTAIKNCLDAENSTAQITMF